MRLGLSGLFHTVYLEDALVFLQVYVVFLYVIRFMIYLENLLHVSSLFFFTVLVFCVSGYTRVLRTVTVAI